MSAFKDKLSALKGLLTSVQPAVLGVDIGSSVKIVSIERDKETGEIRLLNSARASLPKSGDEKTGQIKPEVVSAGLQLALQKIAPVTTRFAACSVPSSMVVARTTNLPDTMTDEDIGLQVESDASQYIPYPIGEARVDHYAGEAVNGSMRVTIVSCRRDDIDDRVEAIESAGLSLEVVDDEDFALRRAVMHYLGSDVVMKSCIAVVDIGANRTSIDVLKFGDSVYSCDKYVGGEKLTSQLIEMFGVTREEAEAKKRSTIDDTGLVNAHSAEVASEISHALMLFKTSAEYRDVDRVILVGGGATVALQTMLQSGGVASEVQILPHPSYALAFGLALRSFEASETHTPRVNFLPYREKLKRVQIRRYSILAGISLAAGLILAGIGHMAFQGAIYSQDLRNAKLENGIAKIEQDLTEIKKMKDQTKGVVARKAIVEGLQASRSDATLIFSSLVTLLPGGVWLKDLTQDGGKITINGYAQSNASISMLMHGIDASVIFKDSALIESRIDSAGSIKANVFSMTMKIRREVEDSTDVGKKVK